MQDKKIIVFDGVCILCNGFVQWIIEHDRNKQFFFSTAQSNFIQNLNKKIAFPMSAMDSVIYLRNGIVHTESKAIFMILKDLGGWWKMLALFRVIPSFISNFFYRIIAKKRYALFGKKNECMIPSKDINSRFILD